MLIENPRNEYIKLINNAKKENRKKGKEYFEEHHILPKSMFKKWKYRKRNLVLLTPEEHYFAHYLLYLIYNNREMANAFWFMLNSTNFEYNEELYKEVRLKARNIGNGAKKVYCLELDKEFVSIKNASMEIFGKNRTGDISSCCKGKINTCGEKNINGILTKLHWCYLEDKEKFLLNKEKILFESTHFKEIKNKKISNSKKGILPSNAKKVKCVEENIIFDSLKEATVFCNGTEKNLKINALNGTIYHGYHWIFDNNIVPFKEKIYHNKGKKLSKEQKEKIKLSKQEKVKCIEKNIIFDSLKEAVKWLGICQTSGSYLKKKALKKEIYHNYHWELI